MQRYVYGFNLQRVGDEVFFRFPKFPEIRSALSASALQSMGDKDIQAYATDAVMAAVQGHIWDRSEIPGDDDMRLVAADGFVSLPVQQAMKIELFKLFRVNNRSLAQFARKIGKTETGARRLLDLHHNSKPDEIESAIAAFGKRLVHSWELGSILLPHPTMISRPGSVL